MSNSRAFKKLKNIDSPSLLFEELSSCPHGVSDVEMERLRRLLLEEVECKGDPYDIPFVTRSILTAIVLADEIDLAGSSITAVLLQGAVRHNAFPIEQVEATFGEEAYRLLTLLLKVQELYDRNAVVTSDNFSHFLLSFAEDVRVILILIADRLTLLRLAGTLLTAGEQLELSAEASYLYAPLAHRLGLYNIKSEMEDLVLKYTDRETFNYIKEKLSSTKVARDAYIEKFIQPVRQNLEKAGLTFEIKGRTKSISSIRNKLKKQNIEFEAIYDLFAIRIVIDCPLEEERQQCWRAYSIITDMFQPNPKRLKDWLSVPKSNGYESLHITVMGPENKWVEVQIRTVRMDEIAEKGLAAHWRYKGVKSDAGLDDFMTAVRSTLEQKGAEEEGVIKEFQMNLYDEEIYVFTPKGDLKQLPKGATVLDFAFSIHSKIGAKTVSAIVNGRNASIKQVLQNGDTVSVNTSSSQSPKADWLKFVVTSKARSKIKQVLRAESQKAIELVREELQRRMRNRKIDFDEGLFARLHKSMGYKSTTAFYQAMHDGKVDINSFLELYRQSLTEREELAPMQGGDRLSADAFSSATLPEQITAEHEEDVLIIDEALTGIEYERAKCCNPIYGDKVFAFASQAGLKIHRMDCPNAPDLFRRYGYRVLKAEWKGSSRDGKEVVIKVVGNDDLSVVHNLTSQISTEPMVTLRSYKIDSNDGLFQGYFRLSLPDARQLNKLLDTLRTVKGVKSVTRL